MNCFVNVNIVHVSVLYCLSIGCFFLFIIIINFPHFVEFEKVKNCVSLDQV